MKTYWRPNGEGFEQERNELAPPPFVRVSSVQAPQPKQTGQHHIQPFPYASSTPSRVLQLVAIQVGSGCYLDRDQPSAVRASGRTPRPGIEQPHNSSS